MDTLGFFRAILPSEGVYFLGLMKAGRNGVAHQAFNSIEAMASALQQFDQRPDITVYHACAAYKEPYVLVDEKGEAKKKYRVPQNNRAAKAFWIDLDVGADKAEKGKGYPTKNAAWAAVAGFCKTQGFPLPLVVDSGGGVHCYWPLTEELPPATWKVDAAKFKAVLGHFNVLADPTRTADFASIMRPVGSNNKKQNPWRPVVVKREAGPYTPQEIEDALDEIIDRNAIVFDVMAALPPVHNGLNDDLTAHSYPDIPCDADLMANACSQARAMRDTQGDVEYEHWRGVVGLLTFCKDGREVAVQWNARRAETGHGQTDVLTKYDTWNSGPATCDFFAKINPGGCEGCAHKGKVKTPLMLGRAEPEPAPATVEEVVVAPTPAQPKEDMVEEVVIPEDLPGYQWQGEQMVRFVRDKDGMLEAFPFSPYRFYLTTRIMSADGSFSARVRMHLPNKKVRYFDLPTAVLSAGGQDLIKELGKYELTLTNNKDAIVHITAYMKDSLNRLVQTTEEVNTMTTFGWKGDDAFLLGDRLYKADGTVAKVILGGMAASQAKVFPPPKESAQLWAEGIDYMYNRQDMECMQYALCSGFGSLLSVFGEDLYKGIPLALTSAKSGKGKTTVCRAALYAFGQANDLMINGKDGSTMNARSALMGVFNNIPMLVDEITTIKPEALSPLLYAASNGKDKVRQVSRGGTVGLADVNTWSMSMYMTANKHIGAALGTLQANTKAEANRIMELKLDSYSIPELDRRQVDEASRKMEKAMGAAGEAFIRWIVANADNIRERVHQKNDEVTKLNNYLTIPEYRYFRQHVVCTLVAADIMKEIGLVGFDIEALTHFACALVTTVVEDAERYNEVSDSDALNHMISAMSTAIIVTNQYREKGDARGNESVRTHQTPLGRYIMGDTTGNEPEAGRLYLSKKAAREWCMTNRVDLDSMIRDAKQKGWVVSDSDTPFNLGRGTDMLTGIVPCYCFDITKMAGEGRTVTHLKLVTGDKEA
jgi:hypothetical protein